MLRIFIVNGLATASTASLFCCLLICGSVRAEPPAETRARLSTSIGLPMKGSLINGEVLPRKGAGYVMIKESRRRRARFGVTELVRLVQHAAAKVRRSHRGSTLGVADLSVRRGGRIDHHGSHQNGRDVDLLFYLRDRAGHPVTNVEFIPIDRNGNSTDPPLAFRFDLRRNWSLVEALLTSKMAQVQWIFVSKNIKRLLLKHAEEIGASPRVRRQAAQALRQPGNKGHPDHFHVRIYCPKDDRPRCEDIGPRWAWIR